MKVRVASAGTGKTTSLVLRYLELIGRGTPLRRCAGVTFTRKAADELRQRVSEAVRAVLRDGSYLGGAYTLADEARPAFEEARRELDGATLTTIHGFMITGLRLVAPLLSLDPDFTVLGEWEAEALFEEELNTVLYLASEPSHGLYEAKTQLGAEAAALVLGLFGQRSLTERFLADAHPNNRALQQLFEAAYRRFEVRLGSSLLPPSEIERRALRLARSGPVVGRLIARFPYVLVDEFQDVNPLQGRFFEALEAGGANVEVVGDPKQSIYGFRNADVEVFRRALATGDVQDPLVTTRRHAPALAAFLNQMTERFADAKLGFGPDEAPAVEAHRTVPAGRAELHWVTGEDAIAKLRAFEGDLLAERLRTLHDEEGYAYGDMAVLARAYNGIAVVEEALRRAGLPVVLVQGRGYFERIEIRDLYHALRVGIDPAGLSLAAWLRSPFGRLELSDVDDVLRADDPVAWLEHHHPPVFSRLQQIRERIRGNPLDNLKFLIRERFIEVGGEKQRYVDVLASRARENVDALLFTVAEQPPGDIEVLLDRLELLSRQTDAGDVPQSGEGIEVLTVHRSKGLEWPVVAVYDAGRMDYHPPQPLYLNPDNDHVYHRDSEGFEAARKTILERERQESYRLLYVAASRARDVLVVTGSVKNDKPNGWADALIRSGLGDASARNRVAQVFRHSYTPERSRPDAALSVDTIRPAPWIDKRFAVYPHPPVQSPSRFKQDRAAEAEDEIFTISDPDAGESLPGRGTTVGTLVHYAISQNWRHDNPTHIDNLRAQEVMFPFGAAQQDELLGEVTTLLSHYETMLGDTLPSLQDRDADFPELPMALPVGATVWQGIVDRLYRVGDVWYLDDYKTDRVVAPSSYAFQMAVYLKAVRAARGVTPQVRLVYLRAREVVGLEPAHLDAVFDEALEPN
ncbi:MAG: UvrD-helicase domain-containing protein [Trueperaceae bacterium]|nr:UvrD-helicase domain-containing protein [Trueperaceae bacterium]